MIKVIYRTAVSLATRISARLGSRVLYFFAMRRVLNLREPRLFSEKLMKLKLDSYSHNPVVWGCVDKLRVRGYVQERGVSKSNLPTILGTYEKAEDIDFKGLPDKFALKCTHGAGFNIICKDKSNLDQQEAILALNRWLKTPFGLSTAETHYGKVPPSIICEAFIEGDDGQEPTDYKVYCFGGVPLYVLACTERVGMSSKTRLFDVGWSDTGYIKSKYSSSRDIERPETLDTMFAIAEKVSKEFPFVRVDFYEDRGVVILGEMTFTPHACVNSNMTDEGQIELGRLIDLNYSPKKG